MSKAKPHNRKGIYSSIIFFVSFGCYIGAIWLAVNKTANHNTLANTLQWIDNLSVIPFGIGAFLGIKALYDRNTNPLFPFMGFALNGIMVFRVIYAWLGWALGV